MTCNKPLLIRLRVSSSEPILRWSGDNTPGCFPSPGPYCGLLKILMVRNRCESLSFNTSLFNIVEGNSLTYSSLYLYKEELVRIGLVSTDHQHTRTVKSQLLEQLPNAEETFGYITKTIRLQLGLEKSYAIDAFIVAQGTTQARAKTRLYLFKRKNNRQLQRNRKGYKPLIRRQRYALQP